MSQIKVFNKNQIDLSIDNVTLTAADDVATNNGQDFVDLVRDRSNNSGWSTSGSTDAANCSLIAELSAPQSIDTIVLVDHNFKDFDIHYWTGIAWSLIEGVTNNEQYTTFHTLTEDQVYKVRLTINSTIVVNDDKRLAQFIITNTLDSGVFEGYPEIKRVKHKTNKKISTMLSGKALVVEGTGAVEFELSYKVNSNDNDLTLIESMYGSKQGFLIALSGGNESQFSSQRRGYRNKDIYFMRTVDDYTDDFYKSVYSLGTVIKMKLREAIL